MDDFMASMGLMERRARPRIPGESSLAPVLDRPKPAALPPRPTIETPARPAERRPDASPPPPRQPAAWQVLVVVLFAVLASAAIWAAARPGDAARGAAGQRPSEMPVSSAVRSKG
ncbi:hypothetical protein FSC37_02735 [Piscinibacter aquaticus]|uniref:Uncharacterized protein n=1 Tax=Piscinibacter aquaticus TaxID=392597 RepID=A0A5C6U134_9BURK|nr:hypothetical protein FSC37_02735 [Piscinibacter aquaticus]